MRQDKKNNLRNSQIKKVMILYPDLEVKASSDYDHLINIHNTAEYIYGEHLNTNIVKKAYSKKDFLPKLETKNDYFYLLFSSVLESKELRKTAYPRIDNLEYPEEFDINKWAQLVYKIYETSGSGKMAMDDAIDYYADTLNKESGEDKNFKKWVRYFQSGEHLKYSKNNGLNKKAIFSLSQPSTPSQYSENGVQPPSLVFQDAERKSQEAEQKTVDTKEYERWYSGLNRAIRSVDNLLRKGQSHISREDQRKLFDLLHQLSLEVVSIRSTATASDVAFKYANKFKKLGFNQGYNELFKVANDLEKIYKIAQDASPTPTPVGTPAPDPQAVLPAPTAPANAPASPPVVPAEAQATAPVADPAAAPAEGKTPLERALEPSKESNQAKGEYDALSGDVGLANAVEKLEEIASRLSDRRTIRLLAEFDIILDKIGIAPMFPELAEAQSKLIDAYSYALTRVTKMLGMLSSGKSIMEISDSKKRELIGKTMKEVNRGIEAGEEYERSTENAAPTETPASTESRTPEATQVGAQEAGLTQGAPTAAPLPEAPAV